MLVTPKNGTACLTFTLVTVATAILHLTNNPLNSSNGSQLKENPHLTNYQRTQTAISGGSIRRGIRKSSSKAHQFHCGQPLTLQSQQQTPLPPQASKWRLACRRRRCNGFEGWGEHLTA